MSTEFQGVGEDLDVNDAAEIQRRVAAARVQGNKQRTKRADATRVHAVDHTHDTDADTEGSVDRIERETDVVEWQDPSNLEAPPARPGMVQRWVRASYRTGDDPGNWSKAQREGWRPRPVSSVPDGYTPATINHKTLGEVIAVEGLILCEMPIKIARQRKAFYDRLLAAQTEAVERDIHKEERPGMPIIAERRQRVTRGRVPTAED